MRKVVHIFTLNFKKLVNKRLITSSAKSIDGTEARKFVVFNTEAKDQCRPPKVVIIGAGTAGLSAAVRLISEGLDDVVVLEATERPGGRIFSCWLGNSIAEVGAQWITGCTLSNPLIPLASQAGLLDKIHEYNYTKGVYITSEGRPLDPLLCSHAYMVFQQLVKQAYALFSVSNMQSHGSLMNFFTVRIDQELNNFPRNKRKDAARIMYGLTNKISNRWGTELNNLSADLLGTFVPMAGKSICLPIGFISILSPLLKELPKGTVQYSKIVDSVQWKGVKNSRVAVKTCDQSLFPADYVITTVSLGVLKNVADTIFSPKLPRSKRLAIKMIGFGNISKVFIEYRKPFWIHKQGPIKFAWTPEEVNTRDNWLKGLHCLEEVPGASKVLMGTVSGTYADEIEEIKDMEIAEQITGLLRCFTHDPTIPYPDSVLRSRWKSSPYFYGASSYMSLRSALGFRVELMKPVPNPKGKCDPVIPKLFFAGEAASKEYFSTVHGARISGLRAADEIISLTKNIGGPPPLKDNRSEDEEDEDCCL